MLSLGGGGRETLRRNLQPEALYELHGRELCAGMNCKANTENILQEHEILNFMPAPAGTTSKGKSSQKKS